ncbi:MAG: DUF4129 domain-containing protein [Planctomycetes bacterium]|nr:DUF4129 domain-containing protein [Planctomycetota bacterium]
MSARRRVPRVLVLPAAAATWAVATVPGVAWPVWAGLALAVSMRALSPSFGLRLGARTAAAAWLFLPAAATAYVAVVARTGGAPGPALLTAATGALAMTLLAPPSPSAWARVAALESVAVLGACVAAPGVATSLAAVAFVLTLASAAVVVPLGAPRPSDASAEATVRRVHVAVPGGARMPWRTLAALLAVGLTVGLWLFATLPARSARRGADRLSAALRPDFAPEGAPGLREDRASDDVARTGLSSGPTSPFRRGLRMDPRVVLRVEVEDGRKGPAPLYLRARAYDRFDGRAWSRSPDEDRETRVTDDPDRPTFARFRRDEVTGRAWRLSFVDVLGRGSSAPLCLLPGTRSVRLVRVGDVAAVRATVDGVVRILPGVPWKPGDRYETWGPFEGQDRAGLEALRSDAEVSPSPAFVETPPEVGKVLALARAAVGDATSAAERARRVEAWLRSPPFRWATEADVDAARPVLDFVTRARRGHCWCYASAMTLMMRSLGHPARFAQGLRGGDWLESLREWSFRGSDAHAWCEVWFEGGGWVTYDPTPATAETRTGEDEGAEPDDAPSFWERLAGWSPADRRRFVDGLVASAAGLFASAATWLPPAAALAFAVAWAALRRRRRRVARAAAAVPVGLPDGPYVQALLALAQAHVPRRAAETPSEFLARVGRARPDAAGPLATLTGHHDATRYGGLETDAEARRADAAAVEAVRAALRRREPAPRAP